MNPPQYILQPVRPWFIIVSVLTALLLNLLPWGRLPGVPDVLALVLLYWNLHEQRRVGIGVAFLLGIVMDVQDASLLGEHALAYTLLAFGAIMLHRRVLPLPRLLQALHLLPLLVGAALVPFLIRVLVTGRFPGWAYLIDGFVEALIWPIVSTLLIAPQKRAVHHDDTRPI
ncbi:MAG: rod shape-determining protein MreD [Janthinobacterium lividum]